MSTAKRASFASSERASASLTRASGEGEDDAAVEADVGPDGDASLEKDDDA
jgi:hypothetical protein